MNIATMKVHGDDDGLADIRDGLPTEPDSDWQKGDVKPDGRVRIDSGFYVALGADMNPDELLKQLRHYLAECQARGIHFERSDVAAELRISFTTERGEATPSLDFTLADLKLFVDMGINLSIIA
ncbi:MULTISPECIES: hypothetical protein [Oxalobacteraceae]|uniref:hypothetical protein n=1 Tax=Oxalobacteraceae TaxID=75682 RepID=UPI0002AED304|nr:MULTISPECIES: hypothetical protein [Oxalobacteraceae]ELX12481.1 hypothetical protein Jab_1c10950 [Janthinobacterium sp. HH01]OEZ62815.1 hypothetical protein DUGA6_16020 [Duganella sp. HH105]OFA02067.1 hypothetical protein DUGA2_39930 [Duganella sp. HH101]